MCTGRCLVAWMARVRLVCQERLGFRAINQNGRGPTTDCVVGVWVVRGVRTRSARVAGVNASFETTGTGIVRSGGAAEGGRVSVISGGRSITGILV